MMENRSRIQSPVAAVARHRMGLDGQGVTTLVCFHGCPLRCQYCINPFTWELPAKCQWMTPEMLYRRVEVDDLYFQATGGGVTFGGGEPLLQSAFIEEFGRLNRNRWHLCVETSLAVPWEDVERVARAVDMFYVDCKDTNPETYRRYTGQGNDQMLENLSRLVRQIEPERIVVRIPWIPGYNREEDRQKSKAILTKMGITQFDFLTYRMP